MFIVLLKFAGDRAAAGRLMGGHNAWLRRGFDDGVFLLAGTLQAGLGGGIVAHNTARPDLEARLAEDPFVAERVVSAEIIEIAASKADARLEFLVA